MHGIYILTCVYNKIALVAQQGLKSTPKMELHRVPSGWFLFALGNLASAFFLLILYLLGYMAVSSWNDICLPLLYAMLASLAFWPLKTAIADGIDSMVYSDGISVFVGPRYLIKVLGEINRKIRYFHSTMFWYEHLDRWTTRLQLVRPNLARWIRATCFMCGIRIVIAREELAHVSMTKSEGAPNKDLLSSPVRRSLHSPHSSPIQHIRLRRDDSFLSDITHVFLDEATHENIACTKLNSLSSPDRLFLREALSQPSFEEEIVLPEVHNESNSDAHPSRIYWDLLMLLYVGWFGYLLLHYIVLAFAIGLSVWAVYNTIRYLCRWQPIRTRIDKFVHVVKDNPFHRIYIRGTKLLFFRRFSDQIKSVIYSIISSFRHYVASTLVILLLLSGMLLLLASTIYFLRNEWTYAFQSTVRHLRRGFQYMQQDGNVQVLAWMLPYLRNLHSFLVTPEFLAARAAKESPQSAPFSLFSFASQLPGNNQEETLYSFISSAQCLDSSRSSFFPSSPFVPPSTSIYFREYSVDSQTLSQGATYELKWNREEHVGEVISLGIYFPSQPIISTIASASNSPKQDSHYPVPPQLFGRVQLSQHAFCDFIFPDSSGNNTYHAAPHAQRDDEGAENNVKMSHSQSNGHQETAEPQNGIYSTEKRFDLFQTALTKYGEVSLSPSSPVFSYRTNETDSTATFSKDYQSRKEPIATANLPDLCYQYFWRPIRKCSRASMAEDDRESIGQSNDAASNVTGAIQPMNSSEPGSFPVNEDVVNLELDAHAQMATFGEKESSSIESGLNDLQPSSDTPQHLLDPDEQVAKNIGIEDAYVDTQEVCVTEYVQEPMLYYIGAFLYRIPFFHVFESVTCGNASDQQFDDAIARESNATAEPCSLPIPSCNHLQHVQNMCIGELSGADIPGPSTNKENALSQREGWNVNEHASRADGDHQILDDCLLVLTGEKLPTAACPKFESGEKGSKTHSSNGSDAMAHAGKVFGASTGSTFSNPSKHRQIHPQSPAPRLEVARQSLPKCELGVSTTLECGLPITESNSPVRFVSSGASAFRAGPASDSSHDASSHLQKQRNPAKEQALYEVMSLLDEMSLVLLSWAEERYPTELGIFKKLWMFAAVERQGRADNAVSPRNQSRKRPKRGHLLSFSGKVGSMGKNINTGGTGIENSHGIPVVGVESEQPLYVDSALQGFFQGLPDYLVPLNVERESGKYLDAHILSDVLRDAFSNSTLLQNADPLADPLALRSYWKEVSSILSGNFMDYSVSLPIWESCLYDKAYEKYRYEKAASVDFGHLYDSGGYSSSAAQLLGLSTHGAFDSSDELYNSSHDPTLSMGDSTSNVFSGQFSSFSGLSSESECYIDLDEVRALLPQCRFHSIAEVYPYLADLIIFHWDNVFQLDCWKDAIRYVWSNGLDATVILNAIYGPPNTNSSDFFCTESYGKTPVDEQSYRAPKNPSQGFPTGVYHESRVHGRSDPKIARASPMASPPNAPGLMSRMLRSFSSSLPSSISSILSSSILEDDLKLDASKISEDITSKYNATAQALETPVSSIDQGTTLQRVLAYAHPTLNSASLVVTTILELGFLLITAVFEASLSVFSLFLRGTLFMTMLFYLLSEEQNWIHALLSFLSNATQRKNINDAISETVTSIFLTNIELCFFHTLFTFFYLRVLFRVNLVLTCVILSFVLGAIPVLPVSLAVLPAAFELWFSCDHPVLVVLGFLLTYHLLLTTFVHPAILAGTATKARYYVFSLAIFAGFSAFGPQGVLLGPLVIAMLHLSYRLFYIQLSRLETYQSLIPSKLTSSQRNEADKENKKSATQRKSTRAAFFLSHHENAALTSTSHRKKLPKAIRSLRARYSTAKKYSPVTGITSGKKGKQSDLTPLRGSSALPSPQRLDFTGSPSFLPPLAGIIGPDGVDECEDHEHSSNTDVALDDCQTLPINRQNRRQQRLFRVYKKSAVNPE